MEVPEELKELAAKSTEDNAELHRLLEAYQKKPVNEPTDTPAYGPDGTGGYITPYSYTLVYRAKDIISEAISGVFAAGKGAVQRAVLSPVAPPQEFWSLCDHPSATVYFLDIPASDELVELTTKHGFQKIYFVAGEHHSTTEHSLSYPLEFIYSVLPKSGMHLGSRQYVELIASSRIKDLKLSCLPKTPTVGCPVAAIHANEIIRGINVLGMTVEEAGAKVVSSILHAEEYLRDWIAAGLAAKTIYETLAARKVATASTILWKPSAGEEFAVEVISIISDELHDQILARIMTDLKDSAVPAALLLCFPASSTEWKVRGFTLRLGANGESCGSVFEHLLSHGRGSPDAKTYFTSTSTLAAYIPTLGY